MTKDEIENKFVIAHVSSQNLFKEDKSLLFDTKDEAKKYLAKHLIDVLRRFWWVCTVKEHNEICAKWWGNGELAREKSIIIPEE